jgi:hypothetical protein
VGSAGDASTVGAAVVLWTQRVEVLQVVYSGIGAAGAMAVLHTLCTRRCEKQCGQGAQQMLQAILEIQSAEAQRELWTGALLIGKVVRAAVML